MTDIIKDPALDFNGFFNQMRQALQAAQDKGKSGWDTCPNMDLYRGLRAALLKGDFVDAANYALFLQRRAAEGYQFMELENLVAQHDAMMTQQDTIRLANITIAQHEETIRALREGDKYTGEDISRIIANAQREGYQQAKRDLSPDPMQGRRNDELLKHAIDGSMQMAVFGEVAEQTANTTGYITVTRVGNEVTTTAEIEGPAENVRQTLVDIAYALGNGPTPMEIENSDVSTSCDPAFGVDVGEVLANSQARGR